VAQNGGAVRRRTPDPRAKAPRKPEMRKARLSRNVRAHPSQRPRSLQRIAGSSTERRRLREVRQESRLDQAMQADVSRDNVHRRGRGVMHDARMTSNEKEISHGRVSWQTR